MTSGCIPLCRSPAIAVRRNQTARPYPLDRTLLDVFEDRVARTPDSPALKAGDVIMTYRDLDRWANRLGRRLLARGVGAEGLVERISIGTGSIELVVALFGVLKAGAVYVPIDPVLPDERRAFMRRDAAIDVVLDAWQVATPATAPRPAAPHDGCIRTASHLLYTSGSTGVPKGALNTHRGIVNRLLWMQDNVGSRPTTSFCRRRHTAFDVSVWEFFWPLLTGRAW